MVKVTIAYELTAPAGTEGRVVAYTVPGGETFRLEKLILWTTSGTEGSLSLAVMRGERQIIPLYGYIKPTDQILTIECYEYFEEESKIVIYYNNEDTTNDHKAWLLLWGEMNAT